VEVFKMAKITDDEKKEDKKSMTTKGGEPVGDGVTLHTRPIGSEDNDMPEAVPDKGNGGVTVKRGNTLLGAMETRSALKGQKLIKIRIPSTETQKDPVPVGVNGYTYLIKRDHTVEVPESVVEVLNNAVATLYDQKEREDGNEGMELVPYDALRFPFQTFV
jgi:hypothetical protein